MNVVHSALFIYLGLWGIWGNRNIRVTKSNLKNVCISIELSYE